MKSSQKDKEKGTYYTLYRALDAEIARWHQYDPKATPFESPYTSMANNPIMFNDALGDTIKNAVSDIVNQKTKVRDNAQSKYDALVSAHQGDLKNRDIRKYRKESGLKSAEKDLAHWKEIESKINSMIETFRIVMPNEFNYLNSLPINILIGYSSGVGPSGEYNPQTTTIPVNTMAIMQYGSNISNTIWTGSFNGDIHITLYGGGISPFKTNYLANEFGDIDYFFKNVIPNDPASYKKWVTTGSSKYPGYWNDPTGAGQMSFKYENAFETQFNIIRKNYPVDKVDRINWIIHK
jgi:RHS repeat-associated protein